LEEEIKGNQNTETEKRSYLSNEDKIKGGTEEHHPLKCVHKT